MDLAISGGGEEGKGEKELYYQLFQEGRQLTDHCLIVEKAYTYKEEEMGVKDIIFSTNGCVILYKILPLCSLESKWGNLRLPT